MVLSEQSGDDGQIARKPNSIAKEDEIFSQGKPLEVGRISRDVLTLSEIIIMEFQLLNEFLQEGEAGN